MRNLAIVPLAVLALASPSATAAPPAPTPRNGDIRLTAPGDCRSDQVRTAFELDTVPAQRLDRLPAGNLDLAVMRDVGGCPEPVTIRENYGAMSFRSTPETGADRPALQRTRRLGR